MVKAAGGLAFTYWPNVADSAALNRSGFALIA
jgi:hypothetical protein